MEKIIEMLPDGWSVDFTCYGSVGFDFNLLRRRSNSVFKSNFYASCNVYKIAYQGTYILHPLLVKSGSFIAVRIENSWISPWNDRARGEFKEFFNLVHGIYNAASASYADNADRLARNQLLGAEYEARKDSREISRSACVVRRSTYCNSIGIKT